MLLVGLLATPASAQQPTPAGEDTTEIDPVERKSASRALLYSLGGTVVSAGVGVAFPPLLVAGIIAGPSTGHFYAENGGQAWKGIGIRTGGLLVAGGSAVGIAAPGFLAAAAPGGQETSEPSPVLVAVLIAGAGLVVGSGIYDIGTAPSAARDYNERLRADVRVAPTVNPRRGGVGLSVQVQW